MAGVFGKLPSYGDFVRRGLPSAFVDPWDAWLQRGLGAARDTLGPGFDAAWAAAPVWRFCLPAGVCGESAVAGVLLSSQDSVGRRFALTLAEQFPAGAQLPGPDWFGALEQAGVAARDQGDSIDMLMARLPSSGAGVWSASGGDAPGPGWWTSSGRRLLLKELPPPAQFVGLIQLPRPRRRIQSSGATHRGTVRSRNEDGFIDRSDIGLWAVADGAGGHGAGDVASQAVINALAALPGGLDAAAVLSEVRLGMAQVHADLQQRAAASMAGETPATTVVVMMAREMHFACLWAGDSRAYLLRDGLLSRVTRDHSVVQELVEAGELAADLAESHPQANVITRAVGGMDVLALDKVVGRITPGDKLLLCTDGLFKALPEAEIGRLLNAGCGPAALLEHALAAGARDNVTALVVDFADDGDDPT
jgi:protein phosphatase/serine/threonine-protein phosphatase Stp1